MSQEQELEEEVRRAKAWHGVWRHAISCMDEREAWRWQKRAVWALHRLERARRALLPTGPRCGFCERPGHDESEAACPVRRLIVRFWERDNEISQPGEEGA